MPAYDSEFTAVFTNKPIVTPYRGAGRQHGVFVVERLLDLAARELGIDRKEIRRRNLLRADEFPHDHEIIYQDFTPLTYDSGNYEPLLDKRWRRIDWERFCATSSRGCAPRASAAGIGVVCYVEGTGIGPFEGARVQVQTSGQGDGRDRRRHPGPGPLHRAGADRGGAARRRRWPTSRW